MNTPTTLKALITRRVELRAERDKRAKEYKTFASESFAELESIAQQVRMVVAGIDLERINHAEHIVHVVGLFHPEGVRAGAVEDAKRLISLGGMTLATHYCGVKNYDRFGDQREDHQYGAGPRHGSIVFRISLTSEARERLRDGGSLSDDEIEDALYYLAALSDIQKAKAA